MHRRFLFILIMLAALASPAFSQINLNINPTVVISNHTIEQDGKIYYVHHVEPKQTFYSICRAYEVSVEDLYKANPGGALNKGLKAGMDILIPAKTDPMEERLENLQIVSAANTGSAPQTIVKPNTSNKAMFDIPDDVEYFEYRVKWYDTIYSISKRYNISVEAIEYINELTTRVVDSGQILKLPKEEFVKYFKGCGTTGVVDVRKPEVETEAEVELNQDPDNTMSDVDSLPAAVPFEGTAKVALILPFGADSNNPDLNYYDFYSGFLLAMDNFKDKLNIELTVLDEDNYGLNGLYDFIVGPVYSDDITDILDFSNENGIPVISPLDPSAENLLEGNPYLIQVPTSSSYQVKNLISAIKYNPSEDNVIVLREASNRDTSYSSSVISMLGEYGIDYKVFDYTILGGREISDPLKRKYMDHGKMNHFIVASEKEAFASDAVRNISVLSLDLSQDSIPYRITGYGSQRLRTFETIETDTYQNINMHFSTNYYIDYTSSKVKDFVYRFRALFGTEPNTFAFHGYDVGDYFLDVLKRYGRNFIQYLPDDSAKMLQSNMSFKPKEGGGLYNEATIDISYEPDYIIRIR